MRPLIPASSPSVPKRPIHSYRSLLRQLPTPPLRPAQRTFAPHIPPIRRIHTRASHRPQPQLQHIHYAIDPVTILIAVAVASAAGTLVTEFIYPVEDPTKSVSPPPLAETAGAVSDTDMTTLPPGRPGNLTAEQEVKLKEFWQQTFEVFGVLESTLAPNGTPRLGPSSPNPGAASPQLLSPDSPDPSKRKSRRSWFGRHSKDDGDADSTHSADDKHGLNKEFKKALAQHSSEKFRSAFWGMVKHDDPDALMLRFLRARKWDVHDALVMLVATLHWRMGEMKVDEEVMSLGESGFIERSKTATGETKKDAEDFMAQLRMGKSLIHGQDREGRPVSVVRVRKHQPGQQTERALEMYTVYVIETTRLMLKAPVDTATIIFDMTSFAMSNMDYTPVKFMIKCFEANYPESLGSVLVYKSPWIFQGIWKIIRGWLDPVVASKVHFCDDESQLGEYIDIKRIPKEMGGAEEWEYKYIEPAADEDKRMKDEKTKGEIEAERKGVAEEYERLTVTWVKEGKRDKELREKLAGRLRENYWRLDPYVRARSLYDRIGMINEGGKVEFYPQDKKQETAADDVD
ncbi:CRAL/TRIO domain-containing protein 3 [Elsinoe fawcettii]|nr:CRAL/TRIO domain-containing protein 3 [Elsinoe fawcettii]